MNSFDHQTQAAPPGRRAPVEPPATYEGPPSRTRVPSAPREFWPTSGSRRPEGEGGEGIERPQRF